MTGLVWLASYPKSGNTWIRVAFANLIGSTDQAISINRLHKLNGGGLNHSGDRPFFDDSVGYLASELTHDEVDAIRADMYRRCASSADRIQICKVHDACTRLPDGRRLFPAEATAAAIYVIRNPLDVCVSFAHHNGLNNFDAVVARMSSPQAELAGRVHVLESQLRQRLLTWSDHVLSWVDAHDLPVRVVRYEDMHAAPIETLAGAAAFVGLPTDREAVERAIAFSSIKELQHQEREHGFTERMATDRPFFRKGVVGSWREALTEAQAARIVSDHQQVMRRFGYLTEAGEPVY